MNTTKQEAAFKLKEETFKAAKATYRAAQDVAEAAQCAYVDAANDALKAGIITSYATYWDMVCKNRADCDSSLKPASDIYEVACNAFRAAAGAAFKSNKEAGADGTEAGADGTILKGNVRISPKRLTEVFGQPPDSDGYKVSGNYTFTSHSGDVFTLYDWKLTNLFYHELISPEDFWNQSSPITFNIGAKSNACIAEFKLFLEKATEMAFEATRKPAYDFENDTATHAYQAACAAYREAMSAARDDFGAASEAYAETNDAAYEAYDAATDLYDSASAAYQTASDLYSATLIWATMEGAAK